MSRLLRLIAALTVLCASGLAEEVVYLRSGFSIPALSHVRQTAANTDVFTLQTRTGTIELPAADISGIENLPDPPALAGPAPQRTLAGPEELVNAAALAAGLPSAFVRSVAKVESGMRPAAISPKGAVGLMQLMPATAADLRVAPADPAENALGGARYLRQLLLQYHNDAALALAAYNAGPGAVARYGGIPPFSETRQYIVRVLREYLRQTGPRSRP